MDFKGHRSVMLWISANFYSVRGFSLDDNRKKRYNNLMQKNQPAVFKKGTSNDS